MPPENGMNLMDGALFFEDGTKICNVSEITEIVEPITADPDDFCPSLHFEPMELSFTLDRRQVRKLIKTLTHLDNIVNRRIRRYKRFKERMRRRYLKGGFGGCL